MPGCQFILARIPGVSVLQPFRPQKGSVEIAR